MEQSTKNITEISVPKEEHEILEQEEKFWNSGTISLIELLGIIGNIFTVLTFCNIDRITAKYRHKEGLYNISKTVAIIMTIILIFEILHLLYRYVKSVRNLCRKVVIIAKEAKKRLFYGILRGKISKLKVIFPAFCGVLIIALFFILFNWHHTVYCTAVSEIYGIPRKSGEELRIFDLKERAFYWQIKDYPFQNKVILTFMERYNQVELMEEYSTAYNMTLFKPYAKIEYLYTKDENEFLSYEQESYFHAAGGNDFRNLKEVSYFGSNGKLLMKMTSSGSNKLEISSYSVEDRPQLFQSTLLRIPEQSDENISSQMMEVDMTSQQIEVIYNSAGLPQIRRLSGGHINLYGVNGEKYEYDRKKRLTTLCYLDAKGNAVCNKLGIMQINFEYDNNGNLESICYFSDEKGTERTEGFYGVFCETFEYDGSNLSERKQLDRRGNCCYDANGIYMYQYDYDKGVLVQEKYLGADQKPVRDNRFYSSTLNFAKQSSRKISVIFESGWVQKPEITTLMKGDEEALLFSEYSKVTLSAELPQFNELQPLNSAAVDNSVNSGRNYTSIEYIVNRNNCIEKILYRDKNDSLIDNELGYAALCLKYDEKKQIIEKEYKDFSGKICLTKEGYAVIRNIYDPGRVGVICTQTYLGENREPIYNQELGCIYISYHRDSLGRSKRLTVSYCDVDGTPVRRLNRTYSVMKQTYDENGYLTKESYYDENNSPVCRSDYGVAEILYEYWENGNIKYEKYNDVYGHPVNRIDTGYAAVYQKFEKGRLNIKKYEGCQGEVAINAADAVTGIAMIKYTYDSGKLKEEKYCDVAQDPINRKDLGFCILEYEYDDFGRCRSEKYYDVNKQPVNNTEYHCAGIEYTYLEEGIGMEIGYLGLDGRLINQPDLGCAKVCIKYNEGKGKNNKDSTAGQEITISFTDKNGNIVVQKKGGYAICKICYIGENIIECSYYDEEHHMILRNDTGYATVQYSYNYGKCVSIRYSETNGNSVFSFKYHCAGKDFIYDKRGNPIEIQYRDVDGFLIDHSDLGYSVVHFDYDKYGNRIRESYFDEFMEPAIGKESGFSVRDISYENGKRIETCSCFINDELMWLENLGYAVVQYIYDEFGRCISEYYYNEKKEPVISSKYHYAGKKFEYTERGNLKEIRYTGVDGKLMISPDSGYSIVRYQYDGQERRIAESYFDTEGKPVINSESHCAAIKYSYDEYDYLSDIWYIGLNGEGMVRPDLGIAQIHYEYDENGNIISELFCDLDGRAVISTEYQCAGFRYLYDSRGNRTDVLYIGTDRKMVNRPDLGFARVHSKYDNNGNLVHEAYYDVNEKPVMRQGEGYASYENIYENGSCVRTSYYDTEGYLTLRSDYGYAIKANKYNEYGQIICTRYYGTNEESIISPKYQCAGSQYRYDERGNVVSVCYIGLNGEKIIRSDLGYAEVCKEYDKYGNILCEYFYDELGQPIINKDGKYHSCKYEYTNGNLTEISYYDTEGHLTLLPDYGYTIIANEYDECGQIICTRYYGTNEMLVISSKYQCAGFLYRYDGRGNMTDILYIGTDGEIIDHPDFGFAHIHSEYDEYGNKIRETYFNTNEKSVMRKDTGYASVIYQYNEYGECVEITYFDSDGVAIAD